MQVVHFAFSTNDRMAMPLGVVIAGVLDHLDLGSRASLNVVTKSLTADHRKRLESVVCSRSAADREHTLTFHTIDEGTFAELPTIGRLSREAYFRLLLPNLLVGIDRVIYLDADLVVGRDTTELFHTEMGEAPIAAATQSTLTRFGDPSTLGYCCESEGLDPDAIYINSGVLVISLKQWRKEGFTEKAVAFLQRNAKSLRWADQDAINAVAAGRVHLLALAWNVTVGPADQKRLSDEEIQFVKQAMRDPAGAKAIIHFTGDYKPWESRGLLHGARGVYFHHLRSSGWFSGTLAYQAWRIGWYADAIATYVGNAGRRILRR